MFWRAAAGRALADSSPTSPLLETDDMHCATNSTNRRARWLSWVLVAFAGLSLSATSDAAAADCMPRPLGGPDGAAFTSCVDVDSLWSRPGDSRFFSIGATRTLPRDEVAAGIVVSYSSRPFVLEASSPDLSPREIAVVDDLLDATMLVGFGVTDDLELTVAAPFTLYETGSGYGPLTGEPAELPRSAVRDARFGVGYSFVSRPRTRGAEGLGLAGRFEFTAPFGSLSPFAGAGYSTAVPTIDADYVVGALSIGAELGARIRPTVPLGNAAWGTQLVAALGASATFVESIGLGASAEAFALPVLAAQGDETTSSVLVPAEWLASVFVAPLYAGDLAISVGGGGALPLSGAAVTAPALRLAASVQYAPRALDSDGDGVLDRDDACIDVAEDRDAFQDSDGCPDLDNDNDRIPDTADRCRDAAETMDGFEDQDGCPDEDDDGDGVPDTSDTCRNEPEDRDRFEDVDGCPDPDNDGDGIIDARDTCPEGPEDKDGFRDEDGCPDPDNDADKVPDAIDRCPNDREDVDGFEDGDGCPDRDNDDDGVLDASDRCPSEKETLDGVSDDDGCPEPGARSTLRILATGKVEIESLARFEVGRATPTRALTEQLQRVAALLRTKSPTSTFLVETYGDRPGDDSRRAQTLAAARADAVRALMAEGGIDTSRVTAVTGDLKSRRPADPAQVDITVLRAQEGR
jgi:OOP family OmpA-OmpF porin